MPDRSRRLSGHLHRNSIDDADQPAWRFSSRQITTMVVAICFAAVLLPIGAVATTGSLINITDPVYSGRKARVDTSGRLSVSDQGVVTRTLVEDLSVDCSERNVKSFILDTSLYSSIRIVAFNPGAGNDHPGVYLEVAPLPTKGRLIHPLVWSHLLPHGHTISHEISTPPAQTELRVNRCPERFKLLVFGSR